jgi:hypothetical protein
MFSGYAGMPLLTQSKCDFRDIELPSQVQPDSHIMTISAKVVSEIKDRIDT